MLSLYGMEMNGVSIEVQTIEQAIAMVWANLCDSGEKPGSHRLKLPQATSVKLWIVDEPEPGFLIVRRDDESTSLADTAGAGSWSLIYDRVVTEHGDFIIRRSAHNQHVCGLVTE